MIALQVARQSNWHVQALCWHFNANVCSWNTDEYDMNGCVSASVDVAVSGCDVNAFYSDRIASTPLNFQ